MFPLLENPTSVKKNANPFSYTANKISTIIEIKTSLKDKKKSTVNLVSISLPKLKSQLVRNVNKLPFPEDLEVYFYDASACAILLEQFKKALTFAVNKYKANIICINELGMPQNPDGTENEEAIKYAKNIANENECLIIAGSMHCKDSYLNRGYIFFPGPEESSSVDYIKYYKHISAVEENEKIYIPSQRIIYYTKAFGLGIAALICLEIVDYSSVVQLVQRKDKIDLLLVPTYLQEYQGMGKVARNISNPLGGVLLNNCYEPGEEPNKLFVHGEAKPEKQRKIIDSTTLVTLRQINVKQFLDDKNTRTLEMEIIKLYGINEFTYKEVIGG